MLCDSTMMCEVDMCHARVQWPYATDLSLVSAASAVFLPPQNPATINLFDTLVPVAQAWFYFNLVIRDSQASILISSTVTGRWRLLVQRRLLWMGDCAAWYKA